MGQQTNNNREATLLNNDRPWRQNGVVNKLETPNLSLRFQSSHPMTFTEFIQREAQSKTSKKGVITTSNNKCCKSKQENKQKRVRFATIQSSSSEKVWCLIRSSNPSLLDWDKLMTRKKELFWSDEELDTLFGLTSRISMAVQREVVQSLRACYDPIGVSAKPNNPLEAARPFCQEHRKAVLKAQKGLLRQQEISKDVIWDTLQQVSLQFSSTATEFHKADHIKSPKKQSKKRAVFAGQRSQSVILTQRSSDDSSINNRMIQNHHQQPRRNSMTGGILSPSKKKNKKIVQWDSSVGLFDAM